MKITYIKTGKKVQRGRTDRKLQNMYDEFKIKSRGKIREPNFIKDLRDINHNNKKVVINERKAPINDKKIAKSERKVPINDKKIVKNNKNEHKIEFKGFETMQKIFKKNQLVIISLALMLITAGYMNYTNNANELNISLAELGDAKLVGTNIYSGETAKVEDNTKLEENNIKSEELAKNEEQNNTETNQNKENNIVEDNNQSDNTLEVNTKNQENNTEQNVDSKDYFVQTRLDRDTMYSQMLETYQKILENEKVPNDQKGIASNEIKNINDRKSAIAIAENIIKTKDFEDVAILINDNSINVVVKQKENLKEEQVAQISNIVSRELKAEIGDIHITTHK